MRIGYGTCALFRLRQKCGKLANFRQEGRGIDAVSDILFQEEFGLEFPQTCLLSHSLALVSARPGASRSDHIGQRPLDPAEIENSGHNEDRYDERRDGQPGPIEVVLAAEYAPTESINYTDHWI